MVEPTCSLASSTWFGHNSLMPPDPSSVHVEEISAIALPAVRDDLVRLLQACVHGGASVGFLAPLGEDEARAYWNSLGPQLESRARTLLVARDGSAGPAVGTGQLAYESKPNGRHRAEVNKVLVLPSHRRRGIAAAIMRELERHARARGIWLLFLDTVDTFVGARALYESLGYTYVGGIPDYALDPQGRPEKNAIYFKKLGVA